jgi:hypothetical protein
MIRKETMDAGLNRDPRDLIWLNIVRKQVHSLDFGVVQIVVHDSRVVQIERTEKLRLDKAEAKELSGT